MAAEIDLMRERLAMDAEHQPLRLMGVKATYQLMNQIYTAMFTLFVSVAQRLATQSKISNP